MRLSGCQGGAVLDVATGAGHSAFAFAGVASKVVALDISPIMLEAAAQGARERGIENMETVLAPAEELPFEDASFEGAICRLAAHHFKDVPAFLARAFRVIQPGGWLLVVDDVGIEHPLADEQLDWIETLRDPQHVRNYTAPKWIEMVEAEGFLVEHYEVDAIPQNAGHWLDRMSVEEPTRSQILELIVESQDWLRDYLRPHGEGSTLTFRLRRIKLLARRPA